MRLHVYYSIPGISERRKNFQECSPVSGTNYLSSEWFVPENGTAVLNLSGGAVL